MNNLQAALKSITALERLGEIKKFTGLVIEATGPANAFIGEVCDILSPQHQVLMQAEVIGFADNAVYLMPYGQTHGISQGCKIRACGNTKQIAIDEQCLGRVLDAFGKPIDDKRSLNPQGNTALFKSPCNPLAREVIDTILQTKIHCIDSLLTLGLGQRVGLFAGSGVGKSMLLGMIAKNMDADINVIALIGERGREVNEFLMHNLGEEGLKKSVVIVATADQPALIRKQAVYTATAVAEYFCQQGKNVVLMMDSITRFAMAQREISLSLGEPPTARGYTPSVFSLLPGIVERAGNFSKQGSITAFYTVLVEGDDFNEPIADAMRSLLDGHIVLTRDKAHSDHYPAIDVLQSISRLANQLVSEQQADLMKKVIATIHCHEKSRDMLEVGAYKKGMNPKLDTALTRIDDINAVLQQTPKQAKSREDVITKLEKIMGISHESI